MKTIKLFGELGKIFGESHRLDVKTPAEAVRALCANFPKFRSFLLKAHHNNLGFQVLADGDLLDREQLINPFSQEFHIVPVIMGGDTPLAKIIVGAALIVIGILVPVAAPFLIPVGISFALSGVAQALTPTPNAPQQTSDETPASYIFAGPVNTTAQGNAIPVGYGRLIVGSAVISAGISTDNVTATAVVLNTPADESGQAGYGPSVQNT